MRWFFVAVQGATRLTEINIWCTIVFKLTIFVVLSKDSCEVPTLQGSDQEPSRGLQKRF